MYGRFNDRFYSRVLYGHFYSRFYRRFKSATIRRWIVVL